MKKKLFVLSMDAMVWEDVEYLKGKPHFSRLMAHMSGVEKVRTIYPSITYPAHVSIMTGCTAGRHGVFTNGEFGTEGGGTRWHYVGDIVKTEDIFASAKRQGLTTASVFWPVTGRNKNIDYLIDEYFFPDPAETPEQGFSKMGASEAALEAVRANMDRWPVNYRNRGKFLDKTNTFDDFLMGCTCSLIRLYQPDVLFAHNCILDTFRHRHGIFNEQIDRALDMTDEWLGEVIAAMEEAGVLEDTDFVILSDHGQMDFARRLKVNLVLRRGGFIDVDAEGRVTDWRAFSQSNGMSATVWTKDGAGQQVYEYLCGLRDQGVWGFGEVLTREQVRDEYGFDGDFDFVLETDGYTAFSDGWQEPIVNPIDLSDYRLGMATHGYRPEKGPQPVFLCKGPSFKEGVMLEKGEIIDEAPTLAATFGGVMPEAEGRVIKDILK